MLLKKLSQILFLCLIFSFITVFLVSAADKINKKDCTYKGIKLNGKVQIVSSFPDIKVEVVNSFPDLKVKNVTSFPDDCGEWQFVTSFPDFKIQFVSSFPDIKIEFVTSFPGVN